ncbi:hypothetical protein [Streptomyces sp. NPDC001020]
MLAATALAATALTAPAALPDAHAMPQGTLTLSNIDNGKVFGIPTRSRITVHLRGAKASSGQRWVWSEPDTSNRNALKRIDARTTPDGDAIAHFTAVAPGRSDITAVQRCRPTAPGQLCPFIEKLFRVTINLH